MNGIFAYPHHMIEWDNDGWYEQETIDDEMSIRGLIVQYVHD